MNKKFKIFLLLLDKGYPMEEDFLKNCFKDILISAQEISASVENIAKANKRLYEMVVLAMGYCEGKNYAQKFANSPPLIAKIIENKEMQDSGFLEFTEKEILKMSKNFRKIFKANGKIAHVRKKNNGVYEIRCMIEGVNYQAASKNLEKAKQKFIKLFSSDNKPEKPKRPEDFNNLIYEWLDIVKKPKVKKVTLDDYYIYVNNHIVPRFGTSNVRDIDTIAIQKFINEYGETRTAQRIYEVMNDFFNYIDNVNLVEKSPMRPISKPIHIAEEKQPLTKQEEKEFINLLIKQNHPYKNMFIISLYTGLRRSEIKTAIIDKDWITVECAKQRRGQPVKFRKIPISPMLRKFMPMGEMPDISDDALTRSFKKLCPNHNLHELRHTFNTRARECGVPKELVQKWCGHKPQKKDVNESVYMHYSDEYQLAQIKKVDYTY